MCSVGGGQIPSWIADLQREVASLRQEQNERRVIQENKIFTRSAHLIHVNIALESFVLPYGIRKFIHEKATSLGLRGFVRRTIHQNVYVRVDGSVNAIRNFFAMLKELVDRSVVEEMEVNPDVELVNGHVLSDFTIEANEHVRCQKNPKSDGEKWEKKSSSVGTNREFMQGQYVFASEL